MTTITIKRGRSRVKGETAREPSSAQPNGERPLNNCRLPPDHPLYGTVGAFKDDPLFQELIAEIQRARREEAATQQ